MASRRRADSDEQSRSNRGLSHRHNRTIGIRSVVRGCFPRVLQLCHLPHAAAAAARSRSGCDAGDGGLRRWRLDVDGRSHQAPRRRLVRHTWPSALARPGHPCVRDDAIYVLGRRVSRSIGRRAIRSRSRNRHFRSGRVGESVRSGASRAPRDMAEHVLD
jgi:hypothetical protein